MLLKNTAKLNNEKYNNLTEQELKIIEYLKQYGSIKRIVAAKGFAPATKYV